MDWEEYELAIVDELLLSPPPRPLKRLAVVGNGFDVALGVPSGYSDFRAFFSAKLGPTTDEDLWKLYQSLDDVAGDEWQEFESDLARLKLPQEVAELRYADDGDLHELDYLVQAGESYAGDLRVGLSDQFTEWIHGLPLAEPTRMSPACRRMVEQADGFLVFNYTCTLEKVLAITPNKVLHIHGVVDGASRLYFGCPPHEGPVQAGGNYSVSGMARDVALSSLIDGLTKTPRLDLLKGFLPESPPLTSVESFGFSFGEADQAYVDAIVQHCDRDTVWSHHCYGDEDEERAVGMLRDLGFPGRENCPGHN